MLYHLVRGNKIDLAALIYEQIHTLGLSGDRRNSLIFPSLISSICKRAGVTFPAGELPVRSSPFIKRSTLEAQDRARLKRQEAQVRAHQAQQPPVQGDEAEDVAMPQAAAPPPPPIGADTQILRQMFATVTGYSRDLQGLQQTFGTMSTDMRQVRADTLATRTVSSDIGREVLASSRAVETLTGRLSLYTGRVDDIQLRTDATVTRLGSLEAEVQQHSSILQEHTELLRGQSILLQEQSELIRQILARLPPQQDAGPSFAPPPPSPPPA